MDLLIDGRTFLEGPRWHDGRLYVSDFFDHQVLAVGADGSVEVVCEVPSQPSGLGWLPDRRMLVVSMLDRRLLRLEPDGELVTHADLSEVAAFHCNDMVVDARGRAYVGNFGFDLHGGAAPGPATMARVDPDGSVHVAAEDLLFPNGTVITPDGSTLIVGESFGRRLTAFDVADDGALSGRRVWADLGELAPDGICLDAEGAVWIAEPRRGGVHRVLEGGEVTDVVDTGGKCFACMLGGDDRRTLFALVAEESSPEGAAARSARILTTRVAVPGAGLP